MNIKKISHLVLINKTCSCGKIYAILPEKHKMVDDNDLFDGIWFDCDECYTTMLIRKKHIKPEDWARAA